MAQYSHSIKRTFEVGRGGYRLSTWVPAWDSPIAVSLTVWTRKDGLAQYLCIRS